VSPNLPEFTKESLQNKTFFVHFIYDKQKLDLAIFSQPYSVRSRFCHSVASACRRLSSSVCTLYGVYCG